MAFDDSSRSPSWARYLIGAISVSGMPEVANAASFQLVPRNHGLLEMIESADPVVKVVMLILLAASIATWTIWIAKAFEISRAKTSVREDMTLLRDADDINHLQDIRYWAIK